MCAALLVESTCCGKLAKQSAIVAAADCSLFTGRRLFVTDKVSKLNFLIDTGSDLCCFPRKLLPLACKAADYTLCAANGTGIKTYGIRTLTLNLGLRRDFKWNFTIADVETAIIGSDFLAYFNLLPDCRNKLLRDGSTGLSVAASICNISQPSVKTVHVNQNHRPRIRLIKTLLFRKFCWNFLMLLGHRVRTR